MYNIRITRDGETVPYNNVINDIIIQSGNKDSSDIKKDFIADYIGLFLMVVAEKYDGDIQSYKVSKNKIDNFDALLFAYFKDCTISGWRD